MDSGPARRHLTRDAVSIFALALGFYTLTLAPTVIWGDSASLTLNALSESVSLTTAGVITRFSSSLGVGFPRFPAIRHAT